jgi:hypothetical protein
MARRLAILWRILDIPSGAVLGVFHGSIIVMSFLAFFFPRFKVPSAILTAYGTAVGGVTVTKFSSGGDNGPKETQ